MANTLFQLKRSSVAGKVPNTATLSIGELGVNLTDQILYTSNGSAVFEIGANNTTQNISTNNLTVGNSLYVVSNGNVGIGISSPTEKLDINGNLRLFSTGPVTLTLEADTDNAIETDNPRIIMKQDGGAVSSRIGFANNLNYLEIINEFSDKLVFGTNDTERMTISSDGNVGIGNTAPTHKLRVEGDISLTGGIHANGSVGSDGQVLTSNGSVAYWDSPASNTVAQRVYQSFTATDGQTVFEVNGGYTNNLIDVYYNGVHLSNTEYTQNSSHISLTSGAANNALVEVSGFKEIATVQLLRVYDVSNTQVFP